MRRTHLIVLSLVFTFPAIVAGQTTSTFTIYSTSDSRVISFAELVTQLTNAEVVFFGEQHDDHVGHRLQDSIYTALLDEYGAVTLSLEMFETDVQLVVDEYLGGHITESKLIAEGRAWENYAEHYHSMVETARERGQAVIAANAPRRYVNLVSRKGLNALKALPKASRAWLPPLPIQVGDSAYRARFDEIMGGVHNTEMDPFFHAQCLWDASMAYRIFRHWKRNKSNLIFHLNGRFHTDYRGGTFAELKRLRPRLKVVNISCFPVEDSGATEWSEYAGIGDYVIVHAEEREAERE